MNSAQLISIDSQVGDDDDTRNRDHQSHFFARREVAGRDFAQLRVPPTSVALCITVYNEEACALYCSLASLIDNVLQARADGLDHTFSIFIIVDGIERCSSSMRVALSRLVGANATSQSDLRDLACFYRKVSCSALARDIADGSQPDLDPSVSDLSLAHAQALYQVRSRENVADGEIHLVAAVKGKNCGKLDSHWWFYRAFCPAVTPAFCFQMDVGTIPTVRAFSELITAFESSSRIGAVASSIVPDRPASALNVLHCWQYMSFANSILVEWPAESTAGFLSVVPGQLSAFRWAAIGDRYWAERPAGAESPLDVYFKGLGTLSPQKSMLYSAEDRVLCREIVCDSARDWIIFHVDEAVAITDACSSWGELLRQRKRWCNGYMACRANYLINVPAFLNSRSVGWRRKFVAASAALYHSLVLLTDWFVLAISILFIAALTRHAGEILASSSWLQNGIEKIVYLALAGFAYQLLFCWRGQTSGTNLVFLRLTAGIQTAVVGISIFVHLFSAGSVLFKALLAFQLLAVPIASLIAHRQLSGTILKSAPAMFLTLYVIPPILWMFAICNSHDSSWGTKGLVSNVGSVSHTAYAENQQVKVYRKFRNRYVSVWLASNALVVYLCAEWCKTDSYRVLTVITGIGCAFLSVGLACGLRTKLVKMFTNGRLHDNPVRVG